jgi:hypothetical protein
MFGSGERIPRPIRQKNPLAFVYVPKTSGTYLNIRSIPDKEYFVNDFKPTNRYSESRVAHFPASKMISIVGDKVPFFTLVRDPYDRTCSEYFFIKREVRRLFDGVPWDMKDPKKIRWVAYGAERLLGHKAFFEKVHNIYHNEMTIEDYLEWTTENPTYPIFYDVKTPKDFDLVGKSESMEETVFLLKKIYNVDCGSGEKNENKMKKVGKPYETNYLRKDFEKKNKIEYDLYQEGVDRFNKLFSEAIDSS